MQNIWWKQVTNAVNFVSDVKESLLEEKSILLKYSSGMPWRNQLVDEIMDTVKLQNSDKKFITVPNIEDPGKYLLKEFCKPEKRAEYRPSKGFARFFAESDDIVLHDRYLWIIVSTLDELNKWMTFISDYIKERGKKKKTAFILEWCGEDTISAKRGIKLYSFDDYINEYDRMVFTMLAASSIKEHSFMKRYLAELVVNVAGNDIELAAECIKNHKAFLKNPAQFITATCKEQLRSNGEPFSYSKDATEVEHLIWLAQIKTVYPYLEEYRENFVQKYHHVITKQLPIQASYGEIYNDPKDVELGTLMYMVGLGYIMLKQTEYERLKRYKDARNSLSHLTALSVEEVRALL